MAEAKEEQRKFGNESTQKVYEFLRGDENRRKYVQESYQIHAGDHNLVGERLKAYTLSQMGDQVPEGVNLDEVDWTQVSEHSYEGEGNQSADADEVSTKAEDTKTEDKK